MWRPHAGDARRCARQRPPGVGAPTCGDARQGSRLSRGAAGSGRADEPAGGSHAARGSRARGRRAGMGWRPRVTRSRRDEGETRKSDAARRGDEQSGGRRRRDGDACVRAAVRATVRRMRLLPAFAFAVDRRVAGKGRLRAVDLGEAHARDRAHVGEQSCAGARCHRTADRRRERAQQHREDREPRGGALSKAQHVERRKASRPETAPILAETRATGIDLGHLFRRRRACAPDCPRTPARHATARCAYSASISPGA